MSDDAFEAVLAEAIASTGIERYRWLCSEANDLPPPSDRQTWRDYIAARRWEARPDLTAIIREAKAAAEPFVGPPQPGRCCG